MESCTTRHFELVRRKGAYPYDYMNSVDIFEEISLPSQDSFFNKLSGNSCSDSEYAHVTRVWDAFGCETTTMYIYKICCCWRIFSSSSARLAWNFTVSTHFTIILHLVLHGMLHSVCQMLISSS